MLQTLKIRCLKQLPLAIAGKRELYKPLETLCFIKALYCDSTLVPDTTAVKREIATLSGRSEKTINRRFDELKKLGWLNYEHGVSFSSISWPELALEYGIKHKRFYHFAAVPGVQVEYILRAKAIAEKQGQCATAFNMRVITQPFYHETFKLLANSLYSESVAHHQLQSFACEEIYYTEEEKYALSTHYTSKQQKVLRGDTQLSYLFLRRYFGYKGLGSIAYLKRKLRALGLINVERRIEDVTGRTTKESRKTRLGYVKYDAGSDKVTLIMPDRITVLPIQGLEQRLKTIVTLQQAGHMPVMPPNPLISERVRKSWKTRRGGVLAPK